MKYGPPLLVQEHKWWLGVCESCDESSFLEWEITDLLFYFLSVSFTWYLKVSVFCRSSPYRGLWFPPFSSHTLYENYLAAISVILKLRCTHFVLDLIRTVQWTDGVVYIQEKAWIWFHLWMETLCNPTKRCASVTDGLSHGRCRGPEISRDRSHVGSFFCRCLYRRQGEPHPPPSVRTCSCQSLVDLVTESLIDAISQSKKQIKLSLSTTKNFYVNPTNYPFFHIHLTCSRS